MTDAADTPPAPPTDAPRRSKLGAWLQLLRVGNLFTVPGDPLAGVMLAWAEGFRGGVVPAALAAGAAVLLYAAGLLLNDYFDLPEDRRNRPGRPLPAGEVAPRTVLAAAVVLIVLAIAGAFVASLAAGAVAVVLAGLIVAYDRRLKHVDRFGPLAMGACRGLSLCLGAAAAGEWAVLARPTILAAAGMLTFYIAAVTSLAARETEELPIGMKRYLPAAVLAAGFAALGSLPAPANVIAWFVFLILGLGAIEWAIGCGRRLLGTPPPHVVQQTIGSLLQNLVVIQAALATAGGDPAAVFSLAGEAEQQAGPLRAAAEALWPGIAIAAVLLLVALPLTRLLARRFYAS